MEYNIYGTIEFRVDFDIQADTEEQALELAKKQILGYYHLNVTGAQHDKKSVKLDINASEYEE